MPVAGSVIAILGRPFAVSDFSGPGVSALMISVEDIVYNPGSLHVLDESRSNVAAPARKMQVKKRRRGGVNGNVAKSIEGMRIVTRIWYDVIDTKLLTYINGNTSTELSVNGKGEMICVLCRAYGN